MKIIVCVDNQNGMMFNRRRQSQDRVLRKRILELIGGKKLWMNAYSQKQFLQDLQENGIMPKGQEQSRQSGQLGQIQVDEAFLEKAGAGEYCFVEDKDVVPYESRIEEVILCHWNRDYPADMYFKMDLSGWRLAETGEYAGSSHEKITEERYMRG